MKHIARNFKGHYKEIILGPLFKLAEAILELLVPLVVADMIDVGIRTGDVSYIVQKGLQLLLLALLGVIAAMICQYFAAVAGGHFGKSLRAQLYRHVMRLSPGEVEAFGTGGLITRLTNDANQIQTGVNMTIRLASRAPFLAIGSILMAIMLNPRIGLIFLVSTPLIVIVLYIIMKRTVPGYGAIQAQQDHLSELAGENLAGARVIRAFSRQEQAQKEFDAEGEALSGAMVRVGKLSAALNPITSLIVNIAIGAIVWVGANFAFQGLVQPGEIIALVSYMNQTLLALLVAANLIVIFTRAVASTRRVAAVLDIEPAITDGAGAACDEKAPLVSFQNVDFAYHAGAGLALENLTFAIERGETVGVIGGTGSGKTTLANLILRYFDVTGGSVLVQGADVKDFALHDLRSMVGLVPQKAALLAGSVRYNLAISAPGADDAALWRALETAQAAEFVRRMPGKLDAMIEAGGKNLSGGQRQRLTIARALVREADLLILDDSASALDYATDAALRRALHARNAENGGCFTTLIISQRASTIKSADMILVLDDGRLVGSGTHEALLQENDVYREICASQGLWAPEGGAA